jgi:two-component system cell cycle response regulator DivK
MTPAANLVLIVEDNERNRRLFRDLLHYYGYPTLEAATGAEGIELALRHRPALVLLDIQLPDIDGVTVLGRLRHAADGLTCPVVALTAYAMKDDAARFLGVGFDGYIAKPIDIQAFPGLIQRYLYHAADEHDPAGAHG